MLEQLASLAARPFGSRDEAVAAVLDLIHQVGGLRTPFLARTNRGLFEVVAVDSRGGCPLEVGTTLPLVESYCHHVVTTGRPLVVDDARATAPFKDLQVTADLDIGSYVGVPVVLSSGETYGTLCAIDPELGRVAQDDQELLVLLARLVAFQVDRAEAQAEMHAVLNSADEAIVLVSPDRHFRAVNRAFEEIFGFTAAQVIGRPFADFYGDLVRVFADPQRFAQLVVGSSEDASRVFSEVVVQLEPTPRELILYSRPVHADDGSYIGRLYALRDVTREREVERLKTQFVSMVSHELRTPLTSIKGFVDLLLEGDAGELPPAPREYLGIVKTNADRLVKLIDDLLDVSRMDEGRIELRLGALDLAPLLGGVGDLLSPQVAAKGQRLALDLPDDLPPVYADHDRVIQVVTNLLSNAHKYTPEGGSIELSARALDRQVQVAVKDSGIGLSADDQARLFTRFFRADNAATRQAGGTGLGLAITRTIVEKHGGAMSVESAPGRGSTFAFTLPTLAAAGVPVKR